MPGQLLVGGTVPTRSASAALGAVTAQNAVAGGSLGGISHATYTWAGSSNHIRFFLFARLTLMKEA